jgi:uncharacterized tellurite resistance protein B-like protein
MKKFFGFLKEKKEEIRTISVNAAGNPLTKEQSVAVAALLVEVVGRDGEVVPEEAEELVAQISMNLGVEESKVPELVKEAIDVRGKKKGSIDPFVALVKDIYSLTQRETILRIAWQLVLADTVIDDEERRFMIQLGTRLQITPEKQEEIRNEII